MTESSKVRSTVNFSLTWALVSVVLVSFYTNCTGSFKAVSLDQPSSSNFSAGSDSPGAGSGVGDQFATGKSLYNSNCASCHGVFDQTTKKGRSFESIKIAISDISLMNSLKSLDTVSLQYIAQALNGMGSGNQSPGAYTGDIKTNPYLCNSSQDPGISITRRLTKKEYLATLAMLFPSHFNTNDFQIEIDSIPADSVSNLFSTSDNSVSMNHIQAYSSLSTKLATRLIEAPDFLKTKISCADLNSKSESCFNQFINGYGKLIFRRSFDSDEITNYKGLYDSISDGKNAWISLISAILQSPSFLYKMELKGTPINNRSDLFKISNYELASRIAFTLTGRGPDQQLFSEAESGQLTNASQYNSIIQRVISSQESKNHLQQFYGEYFSIDRIPIPSQPDWFVSSSIRNSLRSEAQQELKDIVEYYTWTTQGSLADLLTTDKNFAKGPALTSIYGVNSDDKTIPSNQRSGITTRAGILISQSQNVSLVHRGLLIRRNFLCEKIPPPNFSDVDPTLLMAPAPSPLESTRAQLEKRTAPARCMTCHSSLNPMGFVAENYDAIGRFRSTEKIFDSSGNVIAEHPLNLKVSPNINATTDKEVNGPTELASVMAKSSRVAACFTEQWVTFSKGRDVTMADSCSLNFMYQRLINGETNSTKSKLLDMFSSIVQEPHFQYRKLEQ